MKKGKNLLSVFLAMLMIFSVVPLLPVSATNYAVELGWVVEDATSHDAKAEITIKYLTGTGVSSLTTVVDDDAYFNTDGNQRYTVSVPGNPVVFMMRYSVSNENIFSTDEGTIVWNHIKINGGENIIGHDDSLKYTFTRGSITSSGYGGTKAFYMEGYSAYSGAETNALITVKKYPDGYSFDEDSYNFRNYTAFIPYGYFKTMYKDGKAWSLFKNEWYQGGLCFGMTYTTASYYNGLPSGHTVRNLSDNSRISIGNNVLTVDTFIKYAHIYQFSAEFINGTVWTNGGTIYNLVKEYLSSNNIGVTIGMTKRDGTGGHRVLAVGIDGNDILIDDPNNTSGFERISVNSDGSWSFSGLSGYNSTTCYIRYNLDYYAPYKFLSTMKTLNVNNSFISESTIDEIAKNSTSEYLSEDYLLLSVNCEEYDISNSNLSKIEAEYSSDTDVTNRKDLYWIGDDKTVNVIDLSGKAEIEVAGNENVTSIITENSSKVSVTVDEENSIIKTNLDSVKDNEYSVSSTTFDSNSDSITLTVSGTADGTNITATQTETGLTVTGISDGTVTLTKDEEIIAASEITDACGDVEVIYDAEGETDELGVDYHTHSYTSSQTKEPTCIEKGEFTYTCTCNDVYTKEIAIDHDNHIGETEIRNAKDSGCTEQGYTGDTYCKDCGEMILSGKEIEPVGHNDSDGNNTCDTCGETIENCSHLCHKTGFMSFIWKIIRFFCKLFKANSICDCGISHY